MLSSLEFTGAHTQLKAMYESGYGVAKIMQETGLDYERVMNRLRTAGVTLITGGPHDVTRCEHDHDLAELHARGAACCRARFGRRRDRG